LWLPLLVRREPAVVFGRRYAWLASMAGCEPRPGQLSEVMSTEMRVTAATEADVPAIAAMRAALGWHPNQWLLRALHHCEDGRIFLIRSAVNPTDGVGETWPRDFLASAAAVSYGARGFIGNVMVHAAARRRGLGELVMRAALDWLRAQRTAVVELDATTDGQPLYQRLGFAGTQPSWFMRSTVGRRQRDELARMRAGVRAHSLDATELDQVAKLDQAAFGGDRMELLRHILAGGDSRLFAARGAAGTVEGFLMARQFSAGESTIRIGPWVSTSPGVAADLLLQALADAESRGHVPSDGHPAVLACIEGACTQSLGLLRGCGLDVVEDDLRMRLDLAAAWEDEHAPSTQRTQGRPDWVYAMTAPMVG
jgi:ribosomal protein S18 acetylase RimI-like enzyme